MTLQECYAALEGSYDEVLGRLRSDRLIQKFVLKFLDDGSYRLLCDSLNNGSHDEAFRAAHTIKGMCQNLAFTKLEQSSTTLTEALRSGTVSADDPMVAQVMKDYAQTVDAIRAFQAANGL